MKIIHLFLIILIFLSYTYSQNITIQYEEMKYKSFKISFQKDLNLEEVKSIGDQLDHYLNHWKNILKIKKVRNVEFRLYKSEKAYKNKSNVNFNQEVFLYKDIIHLSPKIFDRNYLLTDKLLANAVVLALLKESGKKGCPKWLIESYAIYLSGMRDADQQSTINISYSLKDFKQEYSQLKKESQYKAFLSKSSVFFEFVNKRYGSERLNYLFRLFNGKRSEEQAFEMAFGEKFDEIERAWKVYLRKN